MNGMLRVLMGAGLFVFGYYLGREVGRTVALTEQTHTPGSGRNRTRS